MKRSTRKKRSPSHSTTGSVAVVVRRHTGHGRCRRIDDCVAVEEPLEIRVDGRPVAVLMRTPGHDVELAAGFLWSEGVIRSHRDLVDIGHCVESTEAGNESSNVIGVRLRTSNASALRRAVRQAATGSSCGTCGKASIESVHLHFPPLRRYARIDPLRIARLPSVFDGSQHLFASTGGLHAVALVDRDGNVLHVREDVGRHNAVDKVLGRLLLDRMAAPAGAMLVVSGRVSFEIMQKALAARLGVVAGISAPTSLAIEFARASRQLLAGFVRDGRFNLYTP